MTQVMLSEERPIRWSPGLGSESLPAASGYHRCPLCRLRSSLERGCGWTSICMILSFQMSAEEQPKRCSVNRFDDFRWKSTFSSPSLAVSIENASNSNSSHELVNISV